MKIESRQGEEGGRGGGSVGGIGHDKGSWGFLFGGYFELRKFSSSLFFTKVRECTTAHFYCPNLSYFITDR